ncbi:hypothetical protein BGLT_02796 [Caballeronia glathei]|nr:hypothetical protein BGLT_02796 [Caballeronia glathei]
MGERGVRNADVGSSTIFPPPNTVMTISPELAEELRRMALIKADQRRQKAIWQELRELRAKLRPIDRAWSDTRLALKQYEWDYTHVVPQLQEREDQLLDEMRPFLRQIDTLEKEARRLDRNIRKAQQARQRTPAGPAGSSTRTPASR